MKKLMIVAAAAALAGVASAATYDYKASVKYVDFKTVNVKNVGKVYVKQVKSTSLTGYLVTPVTCPCEYDTTVATALRDPGFLVVTSPLAKKYSKDSIVKLIPANLLASYWSTSDISNKNKATLEAQGYLFAGIGKATFGAGTSGSPCEFGTAGDICLTSLAGSVIGGSFTCLPSGVYSTGRGYAPAIGFEEDWLCQGWDIVDQSGSNIGTSQVLTGYDYSQSAFLYNVVSGTWSIKANSKISISGIAFDADELADKAALWGTAGINAAQGCTDDELLYVKACGLKLDKKFSLSTFDARSAYPKGFASVWF